MKPEHDSPELPVFDRDSFVERIMGDIRIAQNVAKHAIYDIEQHRAGLIEALETADSEKWHFHAHSLKGVSRIVECRMLADWAEQMNLLTKKQMVQETHLLSKKIHSLFQSATEALHDFHSSD